MPFASSVQCALRALRLDVAAAAVVGTEPSAGGTRVSGQWTVGSGAHGTAPPKLGTIGEALRGAREEDSQLDALFDAARRANAANGGAAQKATQVHATPFACRTSPAGLANLAASVPATDMVPSCSFGGGSAGAVPETPVVRTATDVAAQIAAAAEVDGAMVSVPMSNGDNTESGLADLPAAAVAPSAVPATQLNTGVLDSDSDGDDVVHATMYQTVPGTQLQEPVHEQQQQERGRSGGEQRRQAVSALPSTVAETLVEACEPPLAPAGAFNYFSQECPPERVSPVGLVSPARGAAALPTAPPVAPLAPPLPSFYGPDECQQSSLAADLPLDFALDAQGTTTSPVLQRGGQIAQEDIDMLDAAVDATGGEGGVHFQPVHIVPDALAHDEPPLAPPQSQLRLPQQEEQGPPPHTMGGFLTGNNEQVRVSAAALARARAMLGDDAPPEAVQCLQGGEVRAQTGPPPSTGGVFVTGNNRPVQVPSAAVAQARDMLDGDAPPDQDQRQKQSRSPPHPLAPLPTPAAQPATVGFMTGNNRPVQISAGAMARAKALIGDDAPASPAQVRPPEGRPSVSGPLGFITGNNRPVEISADAMARARRVFGDDMPLLGDDAPLDQAQERCAGGSGMPPPPAATGGFVTGNNRPVQVSAAAMARARAMLGEDADDGKAAPALPPAATGGFVTGNNRPVQVSAAAMARARAMLGEDADDGKAAPEHATPAAAPRAASRVPRAVPFSAPPQDRPRPLGPHNAIPRGVTPMAAKTSRQLPRSAVKFNTPGLAGGKRRAGFKTPATTNPKKASRLMTPKSAPAAARPPRQPLHDMYENGRDRSPLWGAFYAQPPFARGRPAAPVPPHVAAMNSMTAADFEFGKSPYGLNAETARGQLVMMGADEKLLTQEWVQNAWRWIVWKLACYDRAFGDVLAGQALSEANVKEQLCYRYERELAGSGRPAIRKVCEHDLSPATPMTLCVARVVGVDDTRKSSVGAVVEVTDGWYGVLAELDQNLADLVRQGRIAEGTKLNVCCAELIGTAASTPAPPLDRARERVLALRYNSVRPAAWPARLGEHREPFIVPLKGTLQNGGTIPTTRVVIVRVLPTVFMEKRADGTHAFRSARAEELAGEAHRVLINDAYEQAVAHHDKCGAANDPERTCEGISERLGGSDNLERNVTCRATALVIPVPRHQNDDQLPIFEISIWRPNEDLLAMMRPGAGMLVTGLVPDVRAKRPQLQQSKGTAWMPWEAPPRLSEQAVRMSLPDPLWDIRAVVPGDRLDTVCCVVHCGEPSETGKGETTQWVFFAVPSPSPKCELLAVEFVDGGNGFKPFSLPASKHTRHAKDAKGARAAAHPTLLLRRLEMMGQDHAAKMCQGRMKAADGASYELASETGSPCDKVTKALEACEKWKASELGHTKLQAMVGHVKGVLGV